MTVYPLGRLLLLRKHREKKAEAEVGRRRRLLQEALAVAQEAENIAEDYARHRPLEEDALFAHIHNQVVERKQIDNYHEALAALAAKELQLFEEAEKARNAARQCEEELNAALRDHSAAVREVRKFEEHRSIWQQQENRRQEMRQEADAEESAASAAMRRGE